MSATPRLLLVDNYDSFTYNLVQAFLVIGADVRVYRNDAITTAEAEELEAFQQLWRTVAPEEEVDAAGFTSAVAD